MHVEGWRIGAKQMIVQGRDLQTLGQQLRHHGIDLRLRQHEIAHHHRRVAHGLECDPAAEREAGFELDPVEADLEIGARKSVAVNGPAHRRSAAEYEIDFLPVRFGRRRRLCAQQRKGRKDHRRHRTHARSP